MKDIMQPSEYMAARHATQVHGVVIPSVELPEVLPEEVPEALAEEVPAPEAIKPVSKPGHRAGWWVSMVMIGAAVGMLGIAYLKFIDGPAVGTANANSLETARAAAAPTPAKPNWLSGLAIEFQYPGIFDSVSQVRTDSHATEQYNIGSRSDYSRTIAVTVRPYNSYDEDSSYRLRQIKKDEYRETNDVMGTDPIVMMTKLDHLEQTFFWIHQGREVTVSITTNNPKDDVTEYMKQVKSTLRWRK